MENFCVPLKKLIDDYDLESIYLPKNYEDVKIYANDVNRPGLQLVGYFDYFDERRIQIFGMNETTYLSTFTPQARKEALVALFEKKPPAVVITRGLEAFDEAIECAKEYDVALLRTGLATSDFMSSVINMLNEQMAPRVTRHGVLVDVYGEGVLILGESGIGKSEMAIELVKRGHRLIADDAVEIRRVNDTRLIGSAPELIRHFIEIRGIGIVNVKNLFGIGAINDNKSIDMVLKLELWTDNKDYDRLGDRTDFEEILGVKVPSVLIPVRPGRNLAVIVEVAAMNHRQKKLGYDALEELNQRMGLGQSLADLIDFEDEE